VKLVAETFEVLSVTIWLIDEEKKEVTYAASTALSEAMAEKLERSPQGIDDLIKLVREHRKPIDIDGSQDAYFAPLKQFSPDYFAKGGNRVCVPMVSGGQLVGLMALGDRVGGAPYQDEDFELLKCIGDQVAACLRNIRLSQRLLQAREMEAFQTMSAFFVHDLKNTASTLSLMLQNLPTHFDDPLFREDALRAVSKSVFRINDLIRSLGVLRQELKPELRAADLNQVVEETLAGLEAAAPLPLLKELNPVPRIEIDSQQIQKVITNLVLNARDALGPEGQIRLQTFERNGWAVLCVADNGCGMSPEFLRKSLFRPFQTTKKRGMGIGAFHSKLIIDAHKGRIEVESAVGGGTTFRVLLPVRRETK
jgi:putative PEP-CTERM system histidine kinase